MAGITCVTLKVLPCHVMVSVERVFPPNLNPTVNSQLLYSECAARESTNEDKIILTCGGVKNVGWLTLLSFSLLSFPE